MNTTKWELASVDHEGSVLHGLIARSEGAKGLLIHVHGTWGNFYGNAFISAVARRALLAGWSFATVNVPGHDETAMDESIAQFEPSIRAWLTHLNPEGLPVVLQGHSLGALKILDLLSRPESLEDLGVEATFLLSAFDCVGFYEREANLELAQELGLGVTSIVPDDVFPYWLLRWGALQRLSENGGEWDLFRSRLQGSAALLARDTLPVPAFFVIGSEDFAAVPSVESVVTAVRESAVFQSAVVVQGAPHGFNEREEDVASVVASWLHSFEG